MTDEDYDRAIYVQGEIDRIFEHYHEQGQEGEICSIFANGVASFWVAQKLGKEDLLSYIGECWDGYNHESCITLADSDDVAKNWGIN